MKEKTKIGKDTKIVVAILIISVITIGIIFLIPQFLVSDGNGNDNGNGNGYYPPQLHIIELSWVDMSTAGCSFSVLDNYMFKDNVLKFDDQDRSNVASVKSEFKEIQIGVVEWYWRISEVQKGANMILGAGTKDVFWIRLASDSAVEGNQIVSSITWVGLNSHFVSTYYEEKWYHFKLDFDVIEGTFELTVDGNIIEYNGGTVWDIDIDYVNSIEFSSSWGNDEYQSYVNMIKFIGGAN